MEQQKDEALPGTLNLMVLKTLSTLGPLHGYGIARRIEQISGDRLQLDQGTIYPAVESRADGLDQFQMGCVGKQPARQVLLDYTGREEAACRRRGELAAGVRNHDPIS
jgi:hypothetical protein